MGQWELLNMSTHIGVEVASRDAEPDQLHDARRARVDVQHMARIRGTFEELACAFRVTVAPAAASRMTLLVMLSSEMRL